MIKQETKQTKIEQIIMQRQIKFYWGGQCAEVDNHTSNRFYCEDTWTDMVDGHTKYYFKQLMLAGYKVVSINKSWAVYEDRVSFGFETMILEKQTKE